MSVDHYSKLLFKSFLSYLNNDYYLCCEVYYDTSTARLAISSGLQIPSERDRKRPTNQSTMNTITELGLHTVVRRHCVSQSWNFVIAEHRYVQRMIGNVDNILMEQRLFDEENKYHGKW